MLGRTTGDAPSYAEELAEVLRLIVAMLVVRAAFLLISALAFVGLCADLLLLD